MLPESLEQVIEGFRQFPGIGQKTARRLAFFALNTNESAIKTFAQSLFNLTEKIKKCEKCFNITEKKICAICLDESRDKCILCIVETSSDISLIEQTGFKGYYHVLGGLLSPLDGIGPDDLNINSLLKKTEALNEIVIATNPSVEGETTALYIVDQLKTLDVRVSRLARGLPSGGNLEYIDELTLLRSMSERVEITL
ncbi:MAG: recombination protein RecR [Candidatus Marinimicrobia bacterium]|mgnify:CR=1 FL=1|nr:recombination protein RecR [Candidatus Neomarinimicrobiota bacterium]|tara:strand:- start:3149 stop:3739 length:591 start_codon:yes stop_codon:yes gene_type:complete